MAVDKPPGRLVVPGRPDVNGAPQPPSLKEALEAQLGTKVWVVHRLDRDTSGALLFATNAETHRTLSMAFEAGEVQKRYLALVEGSPPAERSLSWPLVEGRKRTMRIARDGEEGKAALTQVRVVEQLGRFSLVECEPKTGRQHQIRVHLAAAGHPLAVDHQYGRKTPLTTRDLGGTDDQVVLGRTPLHALSVRFDALKIAVTAPWPADLQRAVKLARAGA